MVKESYSYKTAELSGLSQENFKDFDGTQSDSVKSSHTHTLVGDQEMNFSRTVRLKDRIISIQPLLNSWG